MNSMNNILGRLRKPRSGETFQQVLTADFISALVEAIYGLAKGDNIITGSGCNVRKDNSSGMLKLTASATATGAASSSGHFPWDIYSIKGAGEPDPTTGKYSSYTAKVWPGIAGGLLPTNIMDDFTVSDSLNKWKGVISTDGQQITGVTIVVDENDPATPTLVAGALPATFEFVFGLTLKGKQYRTLGSINPNISYATVLTTDKASPPPPGIPGVDRWINFLVS